MEDMRKACRPGRILCAAGTVLSLVIASAHAAPDAARSPLATAEQRAAEALALRVVETPQVRQAREAARLRLLADPVARTPDGVVGLDRALDQWTLELAMREANGDPDRPSMVWAVDNTPRTWFGHTFPGAAVAVDNPDNVNREAVVDGASTYEVRGRYGDPASASFNLMVVSQVPGGGIGKQGSVLTNKDIEAATDGTFTVTLDARPPGRRANHIQLPPGRSWLISRDSMSDWRQTPTALSVRRLSGPAAGPPITEAEVVKRTAEGLPAFAETWARFKDDFYGSPPPNTVVGPNGREGGWGWLAGGRFRLQPDEALVITVTNGGAAYTGFQVADPWTIAPDPIRHTSSLNKSQVRPNPDGSVTYVLALNDPGVHNWIDPVNLTEGWFNMRWQILPPGSAPTLRSARLVKLADLESVLPTGTPLADLASRRAQIELRMATYHLRSSEGSD